MVKSVLENYCISEEEFKQQYKIEEFRSLGYFLSEAKLNKTFIYPRYKIKNLSTKDLEVVAWKSFTDKILLLIKKNKRLIQVIKISENNIGTTLYMCYKIVVHKTAFNQVHKEIIYEMQDFDVNRCDRIL